MKYFTNELWQKVNSNSNEERLEADLEWEKRRQVYCKKFNELTNRISKNTFNFLRNHGFHDYRLKNIDIIHGKYGSKHPITIILVLTNDVETWQVKYTGVRKILINYENENTSFSKDRGFDDWGYAELLAVDESTLSHEVLFASGASFLVHFKNNGISIAKQKETALHIQE